MFWGLCHIRQPKRRQSHAHPHRGNKIAAFGVGLFVSLLMLLPSTAYAANTCKTNTCVIACNRTDRTCGLFPKNHYAAGYSPAQYIPLGFKRVRLTKCDRMVCPTNRSCARPVPVGSKGEE